MLNLNAQSLIQKRNELLSTKVKSEVTALVQQVEAHFNDEANLINLEPLELISDVKLALSQVQSLVEANGFVTNIAKGRLVVSLPDEVVEIKDSLETPNTQVVDKEVKTEAAPKVLDGTSILYHDAPF